jgi:hypothetical protein
MSPLAFAVLVAASTALDERPAPDEPAERFTVLVFSEVRDDPDVKTKFPITKVTGEVRKRVKDRKKWFLVSDRREGAEILVEVMNHKVDERMRTRMEYRVDETGNGKQLVDVTWTEEQHFLEVRVHLPGGNQTLIEGRDVRENGGSLKGAASDLASKLEALVKERYWEFRR